MVCSLSSLGIISNKNFKCVFFLYLQNNEILHKKNTVKNIYEKL